MIVSTMPSADENNSFKGQSSINILMYLSLMRSIKCIYILCNSANM